MQETDAVWICKALGDGKRWQIVEMLKDGEKCACKLLEAFSISQPTLSHHMKILCDCKLVHARREGKWSHYSLDAAVLRAFCTSLGELCAADGGEGSGT